MWVLHMQYEGKDGRFVYIESPSLVDGLRKSLAEGAAGYAGVDEKTGETVRVDFKGAVSIRLTQRDD